MPVGPPQFEFADFHPEEDSESKAGSEKSKALSVGPDMADIPAGFGRVEEPEVPDTLEGLE